ncbi:hypothetical protein MPNT_40013 [Candidatus Methylacidithermus pantelleriae]|uniref:Uncharacterized protein n=1 Tax=Candidatus Methylacidithermus pantelleriae TaxID=2744239 RepID=A0A8J2BJP8_9BACT|nr:hypothetical protein MPNT_40013 [Candidatus Methylacidithermus pantelleriae]
MLKESRFSWRVKRVKILRANRANSKTLLGLRVRLQPRLGIEEKTLVFDGGRKKAGRTGKR